MPEQENKKQPELRVTVTDLDMPFWSMVHFMIKAAFAAIPAIIAVIIIIKGLTDWLRLL